MRPCGCENYVPGEPFVVGRDCRVCWLYHNDERYRRLWDGSKPEAAAIKPALPAPATVTAAAEPQRLPSLLKQAGNFAGALARHVAAGLPQASEEEKGRRMALCLACEHWQDGRCTRCGCFVAAKTAWAREKCPVGKW